MKMLARDTGERWDLHPHLPECFRRNGPEGMPKAYPECSVLSSELRKRWSPASGAILACLLLAGCAFPARPDVAFYNNPEPMVIPQAPVPRANHARAIQPPPVPAPICLTDSDHLALDAYFDRIDAWRGVRMTR